MSKKTITGLEQLQAGSSELKTKGSVAYLCHSASIDSGFGSGICALQKLLGPRLIKIFGPQHGLGTNVQDNMVETGHTHHPYFGLPVFSLYSHTRSPNEEMLQDVDTVIVDLQDVGTRIYTYITTLGLLMKECGRQDIQVVVLDRPNPIGGLCIEGNPLEETFTSFVGHYPSFPMRHGMTMGEIAHYARKYQGCDCPLTVIPLKNWKRSQYFDETGLPWIPPSPNLPTFEGACVFPGSVICEGTTLSEGRGTTRSLEIIGHPAIEPYSLLDKIAPLLRDAGMEGFVLRPITFQPMFQKHRGEFCGGFHIHMTNRKTFRPWRLVQFLLRLLSIELGEGFAWAPGPYEYEFGRLPIDLINGTEKLRKWVENSGDPDELDSLEKKGIDIFLDRRNDCLLYP